MPLLRQTTPASDCVAIGRSLSEQPNRVARSLPIAIEADTTHCLGYPIGRLPSAFRELLRLDGVDGTDGVENLTPGKTEGSYTGGA